VVTWILIYITYFLQDKNLDFNCQIRKFPRWAAACRATQVRFGGSRLSGWANRERYTNTPFWLGTIYNELYPFIARSIEINNADKSKYSLQQIQIFRCTKGLNFKILKSHILKNLKRSY
jgi:hypothetical protein